MNTRFACTFSRLSASVVLISLVVSTPTARPAGQKPAPPPAKLILLKPTLRFFNSPYASYQPSIPEVHEYEQVLLGAARTGVGSKLTVLETDKLDPAIAEACKGLEPLASRLARGIVNEEAAQSLARLAKLDEHYMVLVQFFRLETGPKGTGRAATIVGGLLSDNPVAISSSTASTLVQAALVSPVTGKVIWKGEQLVRYKALRPADAVMGKTLTALYRDFDIKQ